ncbi:unnamed protein product [Didymodactylos carnosus]|uniref:EF-hand domain-containing protein n=1 Tax=Didymodactylos carnosus TaxID=1234261 RepID=A0A814P606_9BILA|nr:unnamed protein product [Didymodactylos carnosus]CAF1103400.1 unnamed protein product [Didymodactylos carnosus]CAF3753699.1 unnamed protein product [Didymodactylos carnosus]CAF3868164.1 unnamed protein product [Didymodactylos carnosus]
MGNSIGMHEQEYMVQLPEKLSDERLMKLESKTRCSKDKIEQYYQDFRLNHPTGYITKQEFLYDMQDFLITLSTMIQYVYDAKADLKHSGKIDFSEYVIAMEQNSQTLKSMNQIHYNKDDDDASLGETNVNNKTGKKRIYNQRTCKMTITVDLNMKSGI